MRRIILFVLPLILITAIFLVTIFVVSKESGKGALQVTSNPPSKVYLSGSYIGDTPLCRCKLPEMIEAGEYDLRIVPKDAVFDEFRERIKVSASVLTVIDRTFGKGAQSSGSIISLTEIDDKKSSPLLVASFPNKAEIIIDSNREGLSPLLLDKITASDHEVRISKDNYKEKILRVRTVPGYRLEITAFLSIEPLKKATGSASSDTPVIQKIVILDTPTGFLRVREGSSAASQQVGQVSPGEEYDLLEEGNSWYKIKLKDGKEGWISETYAQLKPQ
ncbi:MAG: hypothetical protein A2186_01345 [Candidatus Levybacteria bacterium RIFOXYA1_FULL_41_10]|nr:MAG: hypothetical protein UT46_C0002G0016 [Candidatus Levybacteria bacterium GW2011_GWA1_39_34]KKR51632.1 MAG: hypothetical protein UT87_C0002G0013 [Candidatus Levybacteria bacterium GW2011_GWC1_40_19]KKR72409.1 MAG: hypothetical protein UU15_C0029G0016 [Candidatus Levybacteria bacterium GW2011_GWC2_40_7]KKR95482.1 MAG: hypothetical protein UU45_C0001G0077 [Candidatus Levybacteria bacterium GW2011_GWA2_41_15]KKS02429.1 MAG: hypothetical protein UU52_C0001G0013 [Candidatus Levybacteria bacter